MPNQITKINLLPPDELESAPLGKFLKWALTYGRYIVVVTELIVVLAFLSRFKLDRDRNDIDEEVSRKKTMIQSTKIFEDKVRDIQERLEIIKKIQAASPQYQVYLDTVSQSLSVDIVLTSFSFTQKNITLTGRSNTETSINALIMALRQNSKVKFATIESLSRPTLGSAIEFSVRAEMN